MKHIVCGLVMAMTVTGCHNPEDYLLAPSLIDTVLNVTVSPPAIPADGTSRATITAQLDPRTDADKRNITFRTTTGTLMAAGREGLSITVPADAAGKAVVDLRSALEPGTAQVDVAVAEVQRTSSVVFVPARVADILEAFASPMSIPADGFSRARITVRLKQILNARQREVTFETTAGILIAPGQASARVVTVEADENGHAEAELQSEKTVGVAHVRATAFNLLQDFVMAFTPVDPAQIITVSASPSSVPADGVTPLTVAATIARGLPAGRRGVAFTSTLGQLIPSMTEADGSNVARASLISSAVGPARVTATVDGTTAVTTAQFTPALPNRLHLSLDAAELSSRESTMVRVTLVRSTGTVSPNLRVTYSARTSTNASIGSFSGVTLAVNSVATATFNLGTTTYLGSVTVRAEADGGADATATLKVVP